MVIICTLLATAAPSLRGFFISRQTHDTATRILSLTRLARSQAIADGRLYRLHVDAQDRTFYLTRQGETAFERIESSLGRPFRLPDEVEMEVIGPRTDRGYLSFFPDGRTEPATIRLTDIKGGIIEVVCTGPTEAFGIRTPKEGA